MDFVQRALDAGGFARLDISDLLPADGDPDETGGAAGSCECDWCASSWRGGGAYLIVADNRHDRVCPTCWGRSPGYMELRQKGVSHDDALARLGVGLGAETE
jgi:hypothetical protein